MTAPGTIASLLLKHRAPAVSDWYYLTAWGGLMSYRWDDYSMLDRQAALVDRLLKGAKPADLPVEQPTKFRLVINRRAAKALGLTIPPSVLLRTDEFID